MLLQKVKIRVKFRVLAFLLTALLIFTLCCKQDKEALHQPFSSEAWRQSNGKTRRSMVASLLDSEILIGIKRIEVLQILGSPNKEMRCETFALTHIEGRSVLGRPRLAVYFDNNWLVIYVKAMAMPSKGAFAERQFNESAWQNGNEGSRMAMARNLATDDHLVGKKRKEVAQLLGRPIVTTNVAIYYLGRKGIISASKVQLGVFFDENELVKEALVF